MLRAVTKARRHASELTLSQYLFFKLTQYHLYEFERACATLRVRGEFLYFFSGMASERTLSRTTDKLYNRSNWIFSFS